MMIVRGCIVVGHMLNNVLKNQLIDGDRQRWIERLQEEYCHRQVYSLLYIYIRLPMLRNLNRGSVSSF